MYEGVYAALPDAAGLPAVPIVSLGHTTASISDFGLGPATISFGFDGQVSLGLQTYRGSAGGGTAYSSSTLVSIDVPPFRLAGTSLTGMLDATCSGEFVSEAAGLGGGTNQPALAVLSCYGSANGGAPGNAILVSLYRQTDFTVSHGTFSGFDGVFVGV